MVSQVKIQRRRNSKGGRWTPELLKKLYDLRNTYSHLSWKEFHRKNFFPGRSNWALQKAFSTYKKDLRVERRAKRMHPAAATPMPGMYPPETRVLKRPSQAEKDPRLRNRKQAKLDTSPKYRRIRPPGSKAGVQGSITDPADDTDHDGGDIQASGRTEKFPKSTPPTKTNKERAGPCNISDAPRAAPNTSELLEPGPEQQPSTLSQLPHDVTALHDASKEPGASAPTSPASVQNMDLETLLKTVTSLVRRTQKAETERQGLEAVNGTLQTMYNSIQTKYNTLQKVSRESQELHNRVTCCQDVKIEELKREKRQLCDEVAQLRDESCRDCLKMRDTLITKEEELTKKNEEVARMNEEVARKNEEVAEKNEELLTQKGEWNSTVETVASILKLST
ncbi:uncharacterized protein BDW47DRAFT_104604 [Aspergillus candidus]|uniref:Uncharacterized protein n=1 Tax=Aspergillus candidus TaxID=41067 RepID=A0A2I2FDB1_ASPCN|nr:hypothetical protein BDW47DRAFT_104604 [Aspergillus candidus]PLB38636.1 hypothetical protein BDW47DRAFT_104604 [Aspergillus candidus]